jgi:hypothetical protein
MTEMTWSELRIRVARLGAALDVVVDINRARPLAEWLAD